MIESLAGAKTPKLDQLKTDIVLGLQELQDQVAKHGRLWNFAYESRLRWERDNDGYGYQIEWSPIDGKISFASGDAERREGCILLGYWSPEDSESMSIWPGARYPLDQTIQDWIKFSRRVIVNAGNHLTFNKHRHDDKHNSWLLV